MTLNLTKHKFRSILCSQRQHHSSSNHETSAIKHSCQSLIIQLCHLVPMVPWQPLCTYWLKTSAVQRGTNTAQTQRLQLHYLSRSIFGSQDGVKLEQVEVQVRTEPSASWTPQEDDGAQLLSVKLFECCVQRWSQMTGAPTIIHLEHLSVHYLFVYAAPIWQPAFPSFDLCLKMKHLAPDRIPACDFAHMQIWLNGRRIKHTVAQNRSSARVNWLRWCAPGLQHQQMFHWFTAEAFTRRPDSLIPVL